MSTTNKREEALRKAAAGGRTKLVKKYLRDSTVDIHSSDRNGWAAIHYACVNGHRGVAKLLLDHGAIIGEQLVCTKTPLCLACSHGHYSTIELLLARDAEVNTISRSDGWTPLHCACSNGSKQCVKKLLAHGANTTIKNYLEDTPLDVAITKNHSAVIDLLIEHSKEQGQGEIITTIDKQKCLRKAARDGKINSVQKFLKDATVDVNGKGGWGGWTALHWACNDGHYDIVELLLDHGAEATSSTKRGTPLMVSCRHGRHSITKLLIARGADVNGPPVDDDGRTPLHFACSEGHRRCVEELLAHGANTTIKDKGAFTPLDVAIQKKHRSIIDLLTNHDKEKKHSAIMLPDDKQEQELENAAHDFRIKDVLKKQENEGTLTKKKQLDFCFAAQSGEIEDVKEYLRDATTIDVNKKDHDEWTALHKACCNGHSDIVEVLLDRGADIEEITSCSTTPLKMACIKGHTSITKLLLDHGAEVNAVNASGFTALHNACERGHIECVEKLLVSGADVNIKNKDGYTPLDVAKEEKCIIRLIHANRTKNRIHGSIEDPKKFTLSNVTCVQSTFEGRQLSEKKVISFINRRYKKLRRELRGSEEKEANQTVQKLIIDLESKVENIVGRRCEEMKNTFIAGNREETNLSFEELKNELISHLKPGIKKSLLSLSTTVRRLSSKVSTLEARFDSYRKSLLKK